MAAIVKESVVRLEAPAPDSFWRRFANLRTLASFVPVAVLLGWLGTHVHFDYGSTLRTMAQVNAAVFALALASFYLSFLARTRRWQLLLRNAGEPGRFLSLLHILMLTWFANCVLPAKAGDLYRAYLLRRNTSTSGAKGLGTVLSERVLDFLVLMSLLILSGLALFRTAIPMRFAGALITGLVIALVLLAGMVGLQRNHDRITELVPQRFRARAVQFKVGLIDALRRDRITLVALTVGVWAAESARLYLVTLALPLGVRLGPAHIIFIALVASLLTTIPALPGGLVLVEGGMIAVLVFFGLAPSVALSVALLDRLISFWTPIVVGIVILAISGQGHRDGARLRSVSISPAVHLE
jgi:uncharacterized protein (TIRG00374 family)